MSMVFSSNRLKGMLFGAALCAGSVIGFSQDSGQIKDRSGTEIFSIISSEIKLMRFEGPTGAIEITRKARGSQELSFIARNKAGQPFKVPALSRKSLRNLVNGFSDIKALRKVQLAGREKVIGKLVIQDFSDLEPAEFEFWESTSGLVLLRLNEKECYQVGLPLLRFKLFRQVLHGCM